MSETHSASPGAAARPASQRPARVWQALDLLQPQVATGRFEASPWGSIAVPSFDATDFFRLADESPYDLAAYPSSSTQAVAAEPDLQDDAVALVPLAAVSAEALAQARLEGHAQGVADTRAALQADFQNTLDNRMASDQSLLASVQAALAVLQQSPDSYFEPLKRLALHLAEHLVLAELNVDGKAIDRLVQACVDELSLKDEPMTLVELHPSDLAAWEDLRQRTGLTGVEGLRLQANDALAQGSVRASANHTQVEDLIGDRLAGLAGALGLHEASWRANSALHPDRADSERAPLRRPAQPHHATLDSAAALVETRSDRVDSLASAPSDIDCLDGDRDA